MTLDLLNLSLIHRRKWYSKGECWSSLCSRSFNSWTTWWTKIWLRWVWRGRKSTKICQCRRYEYNLFHIDVWLKYFKGSSYTINHNRYLIYLFIVFPNPTNPTEDTTFYHRNDDGLPTVEIDTLALTTTSLPNHR